MVYDPDTSQLLLFGGSLGGGSRSDSWTWDGTTWTGLSPTVSPPARSFAPMADDPATSQLGSSVAPATPATWPTPGLSPFPPPRRPRPRPPPPSARPGRCPAGRRRLAGRRSRPTWARPASTAGPGTSRPRGAAGGRVASGKITTTGRLAAGHCTVSGTDTDTGATADSGDLDIPLTISPVTISQRGPKTATITAAASAAFTRHFRTTGGRGRVRYVTISRRCGVIVSSGGAIRTRGRLKACRCTVSGIDTDPGHARGTWSFTLTIRP